MPDEIDAPVLARHLLVPREPMPVGSQRSHDIVIAIAVKIVREHLCTTGAGEGVIVLLPEFAGLTLPPPARLLEEIQRAVSIDVTKAYAVREMPAGRAGR